MVISAFASILRPKMNSLILAGENSNDNHAYAVDDQVPASVETETVKKDEEEVERPKSTNRAMNLLRRTFRRKNRHSVKLKDEAHVSSEDKTT